MENIDFFLLFQRNVHAAYPVHYVHKHFILYSPLFSGNNQIDHTELQIYCPAPSFCHCKSRGLSLSGAVERNILEPIPGPTPAELRYTSHTLAIAP